MTPKPGYYLVGKNRNIQRARVNYTLRWKRGRSRNGRCGKVIVK